jgi:hypothetical protein
MSALPALVDLLDRTVVGRSCFPRVLDADAEQRTVNVVRILVGLVVLLRTGTMLGTAYFYYEPVQRGVAIPAHFLLVAFEVGLLVLFTLGLFTPLSTALLLLSYLYVDRLLDTSNLGTYMFILLLFTLLMCNAGSIYSIDGALLRRRPHWRLSAAIARLYEVIKFPDARQMTVYYFILFVAYAAISFGAMTLHLRDPYWTSGHTVGVMFTNSYLCRFYDVFRLLERETPVLFRAMSVAAGIAQTMFQFGMVPLMFSRWGTWAVVGWGGIFFGASLVVLQLSYLPFLEVILWVLLFAPAGVRAGRRRPPPTPSGCARTTTGGDVYAAAAGVALLLLMVGFTPLAGLTPLVGKVYYRINRALLYVGLVVPSVFNRGDLKTGERWPVIHRVGEGGTRDMVPLNGPDGERRYYHLSDVLYFGNSLLWRRAMIDRDIVQSHEPGQAPRALIQRMLRFDHRLRGFSGPVTYEVIIYETRATSIDAAELATKYGPRVAHAFRTVVTPVPSHAASP